MKIRYCADQQIVQAACQCTPYEAVLAGNGRKAVGVAHTDQNDLIADGQTVAAHTQQACQPAEQIGRYHIAHHNGQHIPGMRTGVTGGEHTEHDAEGHAGPSGAHPGSGVDQGGEIEVRHDHQAENARIHQKCTGAILGREADAVAGILHQIPVILRLGAHQQCKDNKAGEEHDSKDIAAVEEVHLGPHQNLQVCHIADLPSQQHIVQHHPQEECGQAHRQSRGEMIVALMAGRCVGQACRQEKADDQTNEQRNSQTQPVKANDLCAGVTQQQIGDQGRNAGGEHHGIGKASQFFLFHQGIQTDAQNGGDHIENVHAPRAKAYGQQKGQCGHIIGLTAGQVCKRQTEKTHKSHIQEGGRKAAQRKIIGGDLTGTGQDSPQAGECIDSVRHNKGRHHKSNAYIGKKQPQKTAFR